jgi:predicted nucleotidyltransferase
MQSIIEVLLDVTHTFEELGIPYVVVGSFASSARGMPRATNDVDVVADIEPQQVRPLVTALQGNFYLDEQAARRAVENRRSFNAIHLDSIFKVDIYVPPPGGFGRQQLERRQLETITSDTTRHIYIATAEDMVLAKLQWFQATGETSDKQWSDVLGMVKVQGNHLDFEYLREWAVRLDVRHLLEKAMNEVS